MLRVLKLPSTEPLVWQRGLLASEVDAVLSGERSRGSHGEAPDVLADESVRDAYAAALRQRSGHQADGADGANSTVRKPPSGDCAVCFDTLEVRRRSMWQRCLSACLLACLSCQVP